MKRELRERLRLRLHPLAPPQREQQSVLARTLLVQQRPWQDARSILFYAALVDEVDLLPLLAGALASGKAVALPRFSKETGAYLACQIQDFFRDTTPGKFGIPEPLPHCPIFPLNRLDLALVPGVGFDAAGNRLGRGHGFYDRILAQVTGIRCGVAFDEQIVENILAEPHDIRLNCILTPTQWREIPGGGRPCP